ncbi:MULTISPECIES: DUF4097 family beta strand repeat-containing protein [unclassified Actinotalea]|uniref:DUF4097 family beta strand repeat-containing protein n=1 Tax=unclassified Actinotalea TaxID=2638618 RepID=UPI0015F725E7|nr:MULTISPECIES: DUF4097 family beta strand repeat-containing protein [unclassified Actinotalea]
MPTFPTDVPVPLVVDLPPGSTLHVVAGERDDVVVTVLPTDPAKPGDVRGAQDVRVGRDGDAVTVSGPPTWKQYVPFGSGSMTVTVELPTGSDLSGRAGSLYAEGRLGTVEMTVTAGDARVEEAGRLTLTVSAGAVVVRRATGPVAVRASAGSVRLAELVGDGTIRAGNGTTTVGSVVGSLEVSGAHAEVVVGRVRGTVTATAAYGGIRVERVEQGTATLSTSYGSIEVGVPQGTAAWLEVASQHGTVRNELRPGEGPAAEELTAEIRASTSYGDVIVRRP